MSCLRWSVLLMALSLSLPVIAADSAAPTPGTTTIPLWPDGAPGALGNAEQDIPTLTLFPAPADKATGAAVVICPGGGYGGHAITYEGYDVAAWLNGEGVSGYVLKYRVAPYRHPIPLGDAQRAIRIVRAHAKEWNVNPARIGILGFSAGGHLTTTAATHFDSGNPDATDPIDKVSCRPDFMIPIYPVVTFEPPYAHMGSRKNLLGDNPDPALIRLLSNEQQVTKDTPPAFLVHSTQDSGVPSENTVMFYLAMRKAGVPAEMHIYEKGEHGFGLGAKDPALATWPSLCIQWLRTHGFLDK